MKFKNKLTPISGSIMLIIGLGGFYFLNWKSSNVIKNYKTNPLNGIVEFKISSTSAVIVKLYGNDEWIDLMVGRSAMKHIEKGDSISKKANSDLLFLFKKDSTEWHPPYFTIY